MDRDRKAATLPPAVSLRVYGGYEWLALPEFGIACIQAKIDPEVGCSELQVQDLEVWEPEREESDGLRELRFRIRPLRDDDRTIVEAVAPLIRPWPRKLRSGPQPLDSPTPDEPPTIRTLVTLGKETWPLDLCLVPHAPDGFRMRLGHDAFRGRFDVDPTASFLAGPPAILGPGSQSLDEHCDPVPGRRKAAWT